MARSVTPWLVLGAVAVVVAVLAVVVYLDARPRPLDNPGGPAQHGAVSTPAAGT